MFWTRETKEERDGWRKTDEKEEEKRQVMEEASRN